MEKFKVYIERDDETKEIELGEAQYVKDLLKALDINPVSVIVTKNNEVCTEDEKISPKDKLKIISVVSGG
jgi:sulfur carrier protein ThiS